jgi:diaminohydroxyphosphoribosylaminopyrimidine deaminase/5-amino-6-(5-phosphoribosylamino)uracil reductase
MENGLNERPNESTNGINITNITNTTNGINTTNAINITNGINAIDNHSYYMRLAMEEAQRGKITAPPNPYVGSILVKNGEIIGKGYHQKCGCPHAEINAINSVTDKDDLYCADNSALQNILKDSIMYVTLEPCCYFPGKRTPSCAEAIVKNKIKQVVIGMKDPNPNVTNRGIDILKFSSKQENNIEVILLEDINDKLYKELCFDLRQYIYYKKYNLPYVTVKIALTVNNCYAGENNIKNERQWITHEESRKRGHLLRAHCQAIIIGAKTLVTDNPDLSVRYGYECNDNYKRVIIDGNSIQHINYNLFNDPNTIIFIPIDNWCERESFYRQYHPKKFNLYSFKNMRDILCQLNVMHVLIEGGGRIQESFFKENLVNEVVIFKSSDTTETLSEDRSYYLRLQSSNHLIEGSYWTNLQYLQDYQLINEETIMYNEERNIMQTYLKII